VLVIEYDVDSEGSIALVALINTTELEGQDEDGTAWLAWRQSEFEDQGMGCVGVTPADLSALERTEDPAALAALVEAIILADRVAKEAVRP
jgi:hypothetical protein